MTAPTLAEVLDANPTLPAPVGRGFAEPWQASVFAITVHLHERGVITWQEWAQALGARLARDVAGSGSEATGYEATGFEATGYFEAWAAALADQLEAQGLVAPGEIAGTQVRWHEAAARTRHGDPIELWVTAQRS